MQKWPISKDEHGRLETLKSYKILDSGHENQFDEITKLAATTFNCKISLISFVDADRLWFKSTYGIAANETPRDVSYCGYTILGSGTVIINDSFQDPRFAHIKAEVDGAPVRFYAAAPLVAPNGHTLGTLCVVDTTPRTLNENQKLLLKALASQVMSELEKRKSKIRANSEGSNSNETRSGGSTLELAIAGSGLGIWDWYMEDNTMRFDAGWAEMLGLDIETLEMQLTTWESRVHPDDIKKSYEYMQAYLEGRTNRYENVHRLKHADGSWVYVLGRGKISQRDRSGKPIRFTGTNLNITELQQAKLKLSLLYDHSPYGFAFCDLSGRLIDANKKYEEITGYSLNELKALSYWDITPKKYAEDEEKQLQSLSKTGKYGPYRKEYSTKSGRLVPVELAGFIVKDFDGQEGIWSIVEDITEKLGKETELLNQKQISAHHAKLASIGVLAAGVGHEINNPLTIIKGSVSILTGLTKETATSETATYLKKIDTATDRIAKIVQGLRTFSRSDLSDTSDFSPAKVLVDSVNMVAGIYEREGVQLSLTNTIHDDFVVHGNHGKFQQILMNLMSNAKDAVSENEIKMIGISAKTANGKLEVSISDNGHGISDSIQEKIFDPFFTTKEVNKGTGIGLSIVDNYVKEMKGSIAVFSRENEGTKFILELPGVSKSSVTKPENAREKAVVSGRFQAILVEDEVDVRELLATTLQGYGIETVLASNGKEALKIFTQDPQKFDLIVSDMKMPEMDGPTLLKSIRSMSKIKQPKFVFVTGGIDEDLADVNHPLRKMIDGHLYKPFDADQVREVLSKCLGTVNANVNATVKANVA